MKHAGSLESTQEARVALGYASSNSYASSVAKTPGGSSLIWLPCKYLRKGYTLILMSILN